MMEKINKIEPVGRKVNQQQADEDDLFYWADKTWQERIIEAERLRRKIWGYRFGKFPEAFEKVGRKVLKSELDHDDF